MNMLATIPLLLAQASDAEQQWSDLFFGLDPGHRFVLLIVAIGCGTGILIACIGLITGLIGAIHGTRLEAEMKRELLDRGLPADEIATIVRAHGAKEDADT